MYKKLLLPLLLSVSFFASSKSLPVQPAPAYVYICNGPKSVVYHKSETCPGLSHCSTKVEKVSLYEAVKLGRRPCKIEYK